MINYEDIFGPQPEGVKVFRRELMSIASEEVRTLTETVLNKVSKLIWEKPASWYHHNGPDKERYGMINHTKGVIAGCELLIITYDLKQEDKDKLLSAAVLHDICKYGKTVEQQRILKNHSYIAGDLIRETIQEDSKIKADIAIAVDDHMGRWSLQPLRNTKLGALLHLADMIASQNNIEVKWYE